MLRPPSAILAFGDSITLGGQSSKAERSWVNRLRAWCEECQGAPVAVKNLAVGGSVLSSQSLAYPSSRKPSGQEQLENNPEVWQPEPGLVLIGFGFNDARGGAPPDAFAEQLALFLKTIRQRYAGRILVVGPYANPDRFYYGAEWGQGTPERLAEFAQRGAEVAAAFACLHVAVHTALAEGSGLYASDGVHPNDAGHLLIACLVYQALAREYSFTPFSTDGPLVP